MLAGAASAWIVPRANGTSRRLCGPPPATGLGDPGPGQQRVSGSRPNARFVTIAAFDRIREDGVSMAARTRQQEDAALTIRAANEASWDDLQKVLSSTAPAN